MEAVAMAGSLGAGGQLRGLESLHSFCGDVEVRGCGMRGFADRSHESFYALRVRCGKKEKRLCARVAKVRELVKVQRELVMSSQRAGAVVEGAVESESSIQIAISNPVMEQMIKNLQDLQAEVECLNVKAKKMKSGSSSSSSSSSSSESSESDVGEAIAEMKPLKVKGKKKNGSLSSSSISSSSESSDGDMGKAVDMRALRKSRDSVKEMSVPVSMAGQAVPIPIAPEETSSQATSAGVEAVSPVMPSSLLSERIAAGISAAVSTSSYLLEEEPAIVTQIRALCSTASVSTSANTKEIYSRGPIELKETPSGRVIVDTASVSPVLTDASISGKIDVCTVGKCRRGGSQQILASLQESIPESSNISVTSCKCMGKCKSAPNVRVENSEGQTQLHSHVSVDDVDTLLQFHFGMQSRGIKPVECLFCLRA